MGVEFFSDSEVKRLLRTKMELATDAVFHRATERQNTLRSAAYEIAVARVAAAERRRRFLS
jgi:glutamate dehydrogenase/leucine dehydrogenase